MAQFVCHHSNRTHYIINTIQEGTHRLEGIIMFLVFNACLLTVRYLSISALKKRLRHPDSQSVRQTSSNSQADEEDRQAMAPPEM